MERCQHLLGYWFDNTAVNWKLSGLACSFRYNKLYLPYNIMEYTLL